MKASFLIVPIALSLLSIVAGGCAEDPEVTISANPTSIGAYEHTTIVWTSTDTESCRVVSTDHGTLSSELNGSRAVRARTTSFTSTVTCTGLPNEKRERKTVSASVLITVISTPTI